MLFLLTLLNRHCIIKTNQEILIKNLEVRYEVLKAKHVLWIVSGIVAVIAMAAGIAVLVDRYLKNKECPDGYIDCSGDDELEFIAEE